MKTHGHATNLFKCFLFFCSLLYVLIDTVCTECVTTIKRGSLNYILAHKKFTNGSVAVVDDQGKYAIYDSTGSLTFFEDLTLPIDPSTGEKYYVFQASITPSGTLLLMLGDSKKYRYSAGMLDAGMPTLASTGYYYGIQRYQILPYFFIISPLYTELTITVDASGYLDYNPITLQQVSHFVECQSQSSINSILGELHYVSLSKMIVSQKAVLSGSIYFSNTTNANYLSSQFVFNEAYLITSSVGSSSTHMAFAYIEDRVSTLSPYAHKLSIHVRTLPSVITIPIPFYYGTVYSVLIHPTLPKIYALTHNGDLYTFDYTEGSLPSTNPLFPFPTPSAIYPNLCDKYTSMHLEDTTTILLRTMYSLSFFDLITHSITIVINRKPTFSRSIPFTEYMFLGYHNSHAVMYDTANHVKVNSFAKISGSIKEIAVSLTTNPCRLYILFADRIEAYTYSPSSTPPLLTLSTTLSKSQLLSYLLSLYPSAQSIHSLLDITVLLSPPYNLCLSLTVLSTSTFHDNLLLLLDPSSLAIVPSSISLLSPSILPGMITAKTALSSVSVFYPN
jgi:hypothetical protein